MKITKKLSAVILVVLIGGSAAEWAITHAVSAITHPPVPARSPAGSFTVTQVIDGDTIVVRPQGGPAITVRALGIDTPQTQGTPVQCFGPQASGYAEQMLARKVVSLTFDAVAGRLDTDGRTLAYIWLGPLLYNQEAIRLGYAHEFTPDPRHPYQRRPAFVAAEADARTHHRGLWAVRTCDGDTRRRADDNTNSKTLPPAKR